MELLTKTLFKQYDLTEDEKIFISLCYHLGVMDYLSIDFIGDVNGIPVIQKYLLN